MIEGSSRLLHQALMRLSYAMTQKGIVKRNKPQHYVRHITKSLRNPRCGEALPLKTVASNMPLSNFWDRHKIRTYVLKIQLLGE